MVIYFSGTGNSKYITDRIAGGLQEKLLSMDERIKSGNTGSVKTGENAGSGGSDLCMEDPACGF